MRDRSTPNLYGSFPCLVQDLFGTLPLWLAYAFDMRVFKGLF